MSGMLRSVGPRNRPQAIANLKSQILRAVNENLDRQLQVDRVLFTEFIFQ